MILASLKPEGAEPDDSGLIKISQSDGEGMSAHSFKILGDL